MSLLSLELKYRRMAPFFLPMSPAFKRQYGKVKIQFPTNLDPDCICEVRLLPKYEAQFIEIEYVYKLNVQQPALDKMQALAIDLGVDNLAACVATNGASFLLDGKPLKSYNHWYNKENARLQSIKDKQGIKVLTNRQVRLVTKRNHFVRDYLNKAARYLINYCLNNRIGKIVMGHNPGWKNKVKMSKANNQKFVQIPHAQFMAKIENLCDRYGIEMIRQEESYTSKASFLDNDPVPIYEEGKKYSFSGRRIKRGLYKSGTGQVINADVNGAANILRKSNHRFLGRVAMGCLTNPQRIALS
ncbi:RNA-guided endonuclease InsQ/TnpB family protein [Aneurinibacillus tyrosinisolvens]|uniref:RNA-guided endonuclease InsQ/TnpB family protein n=1 Tax=Aneurinibacillus tyrosinisolvens TaxID=1443435 RepID=UPI001F390986|nr:RNA-guided endonuclease TnpB family protein [Aneurinibacillus tyrosinisolvens]